MAITARSLKVWPLWIYSHSFLQTLTNQKSRTVSSWLLIGLNLHERMWINQKRSHFWAPCFKVDSYDVKFLMAPILGLAACSTKRLFTEQFRIKFCQLFSDFRLQWNLRICILIPCASAPLFQFRWHGPCPRNLQVIRYTKTYHILSLFGSFFEKKKKNLDSIALKEEREKADSKTIWLTGNVKWLSVRMSYRDFVVIYYTCDLYYICD